MKIVHVTRNLSDLIDIREEIRLDPSWQRGPVWNRPRKALLIDSILRGFDVPMFYLRECTDSQPYKYEVVDGQQRLRAIWEFYDGEYSLNGDARNVGKARLASKQYEELPNKFQKKFSDFEVVVGYISDARLPEISEVFARMQMGIRLNPAEIRNAIQTGLRHAIDATARAHPFFLESRISPARFKYQDYLAHAVSVCYHKGNRDVKAPQLRDDYLNLTDSTIYVPLINHANGILELLREVNQLTSKRLTQKWMFVDLFYFLYKNRNDLSNIRPHLLGALYLEFDNDRRKNNAEPEVLIEGKHSQKDKDLYDYIMAFKYAGAERANVEQRATVIERRFNKLVGP